MAPSVAQTLKVSFKIYFVCEYGCFPCMYVCAKSSEQSHEWLHATMWMWEPSPSSTRATSVLNAEPSLQSP